MEFTQHAEPLIVVDNVAANQYMGAVNGGAGVRRETARERRERRRREWEAQNQHINAEEEEPEAGNNNGEDEEPEPAAAPARRVPVPVPREEAPAELANIDNMTRGERIRVFWDEIIPKFGWRNRSDQVCVARQVDRAWAALSAREKAIFRNIYPEIYQETQAKLTADETFERNNVNALADKIKVISHFIAMGRETHTMVVIDSPDLADFFISQDDCQNFDACLPNDLQH